MKELLQEVFNNVRQVTVDGTVYYDLYDIGYNLGYKKWDGKVLDKNGAPVEHPYKSRINKLATMAEVDPFYIRTNPFVTEADVNMMILSSKSEICKVIRTSLFEALTDINRNGFYMDEAASQKDINNAIEKQQNNNKGDR